MTALTDDGGVVVGDDGLARCPWADVHPLNRLYHDTEWGLPVRGERALYERVSLEAFQAGLSWLTILTKRPAFRAAFCDFDPERVAAFGEGDIERLMADRSIVRNRAKIEAARTNARATIALRENGGLERLLSSHRPDRSPEPRTAAELPTSTPDSKALAADLRSRGFVFVGPTTTWALMEAIGLVDPHLVGAATGGGRRALAVADDRHGLAPAVDLDAAVLVLHDRHRHRHRRLSHRELVRALLELCVDYPAFQFRRPLSE